MGDLISKIREKFCKHEWELASEGDIYTTFAGYIPMDAQPSGRYWLYICKKCKKVKRVVV